MTDDLRIILPAGAMGRWEGDSALDTMLRNIAEVDNDVFLMRPYCWCEGDDCPWCCNAVPHPASVDGMGAPNFWHRASGLKVWWYKYIGRGVEVVGPAPVARLLSRVERECLAALDRRWPSHDRRG